VETDSKGKFNPLG